MGLLVFDRLYLTWKDVILYLKSRKGMGTIEVVIIIAVLVALALIFKDFIIGLAQDLFDKIQANASAAATEL